MLSERENSVQIADNMLIEGLNQKINELSCELEQNQATFNIYKQDI